METLIGYFLDVTNATPSIAREYLALARDDVELALCMWFDQGTAQTEKAAFQPVVSPQTGDRSASLLAEIRAELATLEGEILEVGKLVTGLEKSIASAVEKCLRTTEEDLMQNLLKCDGLDDMSIREQRRATIKSIQSLQGLLDGHVSQFNAWKVGTAKL